MVRYASMTVDMKALVADETVRGAVVGSGAFGAGYLIQRGDGQTFLKIFHANRRPALAFEKPGAPAQDVPVAAARQPLGAPVAADSDRPLGILSQAEVSSLRDGASVELIPKRNLRRVWAMVARELGRRRYQRTCRKRCPHPLTMRMRSAHPTNCA